MKILDATCGFKGIWYQKNHPFVTFMDIRTGKTKNSQNTKIKNRRYHKLDPNIVADWTKSIPFDDNYFDMIIFDPPHIIENKSTPISNMGLRYGRLNRDNYKETLSKGIRELFRVLKPEGVFIFKWNERGKESSITNILKLFPYQPLFGTRTGQRNNTHWILFLKYDVNAKLTIHGSEQK